MVRCDWEALAVGQDSDSVCTGTALSAGVRKNQLSSQRTSLAVMELIAYLFSLM